MQNRWLHNIFLGAVLVLVVTNVVLIASLFRMRQHVVSAAAEAADMLTRIQAGSSDSPLVIAVDANVSVPVKTNIPVDTIVEVPVVIPLLGQQTSVRVPIRANVPVDTIVQIPIRTSVPLTLPSASSQFGNALNQLRTWLLSLSGDF